MFLLTTPGSFQNIAFDSFHDLNDDNYFTHTKNKTNYFVYHMILSILFLFFVIFQS